MPELPEVETTRRGIAPHLEGQRVSRVVVRERRLRWPIPEDLDVRLSGQRIVLVERRAKYLLINAEVGTLISHLGMSGNLRLVEVGMPARPSMSMWISSWNRAWPCATPTLGALARCSGARIRTTMSC